MDTPNNTLNAMKTGTRFRLTIGELPKVMKRQVANVRKYRRELEALVAEANGGTVDAHAAHLIDEACQAETHSAICRWLLRTRLDTMSVSDITRCSEQILKAKTARNKAVERLGIGTQADPWDELYSKAKLIEHVPADDDTAAELEDK